MDSDGDRVAIGAYGNDGTGACCDAGHVRVMAATTTWWVDSKNGNDNNDGIFESSAFKTVQKAIESNSNLTNGDTIKVKPSLASDGTLSYYDFGNDDISSSKKFVLISTAGADSTILDAESKNRHFRFNGDQDSTLQIVGFTFKNGKVTDHYGGSIYIESDTRPVFKDCVFEDNLV